METSVLEYYRQALSEKGYGEDPAQRIAVERLEVCRQEWVAYKSRRSNRFTKMLVHPPLPRGLYLWGGVGRGKSFLMDCFYVCVPVVRKVRIHFHEFMRTVHQALDELKGTPNPLDAVAARVAKKYRLICFDEFHVSDIADAMILERLLRALIKNGVCFVMTSNYPPSGLYPGGLHRDRFLPGIALLEETLEIMNVDHGVDYRKREMAQVDAYLSPLGAQTSAQLREIFERFLTGSEEMSPVLRIEAREIRALRRTRGVIWFDFRTLCGGPRSQNDYLELVHRFHTVILSDVPEMTPAMSSEARRFTWLVDILYDNRVKLIISAEVPPEQLYCQGTLANEFQRTVSRLIEMQSREYLEAPKRGVPTD